MASSLLFDVVLVDGNHEPLMLLKKAVPMAEAIKLSTKHNDDPSETLTAVVAMQGSVPCTLGLSPAIEASSEQDDSDVTEGTKDAVGANVEGLVYRVAIRERYEFVRREFRRHLKRMLSAADHVCDSGDIGIVAASLEELARGIDDWNEKETFASDWAFNNGKEHNWRNDELEAALGLEVS